MKQGIRRKAAPVYAVSFGCIGGKDVMPVGGWWGPFVSEDDDADYVTDFIKDKYFEMIAEAGVNVITVTPNTYGACPAETMRCLELAEKYNMGFFVHDGFFNDVANKNKLAERAALFAGYKSCVGFHLIDEPSAKRFDALSQIYSAFERTGSHLLLYTNMLPRYASGELLSGDKGGEMSLEEYLSLYLSKVRTKFLSYDFYPYSKKDGGNEKFEWYFENLSLAKKLCDEHGIPLWTFVQAGGQWDRENKPSVERYPSEGEFLFDVNANLAYGVKSIQYFTLIQPQEFSHTDTGRDYRRIGLIGADGRKNEWYDMARRANRQISSIGHILMNASCEGIIAVGETVQRNIGTGLPYTLCEIGTDGKRTHSRKYYELCGVSGSGIMIGCFNYRGGTALYAVNYDTKKTNEAVLHFDGEYAAKIYKDGVCSDFCGKDCALHFGAGEGIMVEIL